MVVDKTNVTLQVKNVKKVIKEMPWAICNIILKSMEAYQNVWEWSPVDAVEFDSEMFQPTIFG